jgi:hypothetical protein
VDRLPDAELLLRPEAEEAEDDAFLALQLERIRERLKGGERDLLEEAEQAH